MKYDNIEEVIAKLENTVNHLEHVFIHNDEVYDDTTINKSFS